MKYFAYGMNMNKEIMQDRCTDAVPIGKYELPGYQLVFRGVADIVKVQHQLVFRGVADIVKVQHQRVVGALWEISEADEIQLDFLEGYPRLYGKEYYDDVMFYTMDSSDIDGLYGLCAPDSFYASIVLQGLINFDITQHEFLTSLGCDTNMIGDKLYGWLNMGR